MKISKFTCGYCKKRTEITNEEFQKALETNIMPICPKCGQYSYNSSLQTAFLVNPKDWRVVYGSIKR